MQCARRESMSDMHQLLFTLPEWTSKPYATIEPIDVVWLKKDVHHHDYGPLSLNVSFYIFINLIEWEISYKEFALICLLFSLVHQIAPLTYLFTSYLQLCNKIVHGSLIEFVNKGFVNLNRRLSGNSSLSIDSCKSTNICYKTSTFHWGMWFSWHEDSKQNKRMEEG